MTAAPADIAGTISDIVRALSSGVTVGEGQPVNRGGTFRRQSLDEAYRWYHGAAYAPRAGGGAASRLCKDCGGRGWVEPRCVDGKREHSFGAGNCRCGFADPVIAPAAVADPTAYGYERCETCTPRDVSDPTGETTAEQRQLRDRLDEAHKALTRARVEVDRAVACIRACETVIDKAAERVALDERGLWPRTADSGEVKAAKAAQARRAARGEDVA